MGLTEIKTEDLSSSVADALQLISYTHPPDFIRQLAAAWAREQSAQAKAAMAQMLVNSRMALLGQRPVCQDTGIVNVFLRIGMGVRFDNPIGLQEIIDEGVRRAYRNTCNPLRPSMVADPLFARTNTGDNTPAIVHCELVAGNSVQVTLAAKGAGSDNKARFAVLLPGASLSDWVERTVPDMGAGWCPPGVLGLGVGGTVEHSMLLAKQALLQEIDMSEIIERGPATPLERLRVEIYEKVNALGIGAQGLGGLTTVLDVKIKSFPTHAASLPIAMIPNCAATRHWSFTLDGSGPARMEVPSPSDWPDFLLDTTSGAKRVNLETLSREEVRSWKMGETLLLTGKLLTARDAAHRRLQSVAATGNELPVDLAGRVLYYVGPVEPIAGEITGPAGPTTSSRMDPYMELILGKAGVLATIGKGERGAEAVAAIHRYGAASLVAVGGAAYLISKAIVAARVVALGDLGMEAIQEFEVRDMPVVVAVDAQGHSIHIDGPAAWRQIRLPKTRS